MEIATGLKDSLVSCTTFPTLTLLRIFEFFPRVFFSASLYAFSRPRNPTLFPRLRSVLQHFCFSPPSHHPPAAVKEGGGGACRRRNFFGLSTSSICRRLHMGRKNTEEEASSSSSSDAKCELLLPHCLAMRVRLCRVLYSLEGRTRQSPPTALLSPPAS